MAKTLKDLVAAARAQIEEISAEQLQQIKESGTEFLLVDVREAAEYAAGHIAGAASIPRGVIELSADQVYPKRHENRPSTDGIRTRSVPGGRRGRMERVRARARRPVAGSVARAARH
jgi:hypothetical protein